jgi:hypothetical protein
MALQTQYTAGNATALNVSNGDPIKSRYCALTIQQQLDSITGANNPFAVEQQTFGFVNALLSDRNTSGFEQVQELPRPGKSPANAQTNARVEIAYYPKEQFNISDSALTSACDTHTPDADNQVFANVTVDKVASAGFTLNEEEFRQLVESYPERLGRKTAELLLDMKKKINLELIKLAYTSLGAYFTPPGATPSDSKNPAQAKTLALFNASMQPHAMGLYPIANNYSRQGYLNPIIVGGNTLDQWAYASQIYRGDFAAGNGRDISRVPGGMEFYTDYILDTAIDAAATAEGTYSEVAGTENMLSWAAGHLQMLAYNEHVGIYERFREGFEKTTITYDGMVFDFGYYNDDCSGLHHFNYQARYDLFVTPFSTDGVGAGNSLTRWKVDCGNLSCTYGDPDIYANL